MGSEKSRWQETASKLEDHDLKNLIGNMVLAAGCVAYVGPFSAPYRIGLLQGWVETCMDFNLPVDSAFSLTNTVGDPVEIREWNILGLPADDFSTENGIIATRGRRWPLMIDPQSQANRWVKNLNKGNNLQVIKLTDKAYLRTLENGIRYGQPVLLENVQEELDPSLEPVLLKQIFKKSGQWLLHLGDSDIPYSDDFKFYITTKLANPHYLPEVCIKVTIINFTVTLKGLEDQLLVDVVRNERPDLEAKKDELVVNIASDTRQLKEIEDKILHMLANSSGNILDDEDLINNLAASKVTSKAIGERMIEAEVTTLEINTAREKYRDVATRGSILYFVIASLALVDPMYQYSLQYFQVLYNMRIRRSEACDDLQGRLDILIADITLNFYIIICRGLFEKDKLLFSFFIAVEVLRHQRLISDGEFSTFLVGPTDMGDTDDKPAEKEYAFLKDKVWGEMHALQHISTSFDGLVDCVMAEPAAWQEYCECSAPQDMALPCGFGEGLTELSVGTPQ